MTVIETHPLMLYQDQLRYFVVLPGWEKELTDRGAPTHHLGQYLTLHIAAFEAAHCQHVLPTAQVYDSWNACLIAVEGPQSVSPVLIEYWHFDTAGTVALAHAFYRPDHFLTLLAASHLP